MPRVPFSPWQEPKRKGPPTLDTEEVRKRLGFKDAESVRQLVRRGPENDGLPGYVEEKDSDGEYHWVRRTEPASKRGPHYQFRFYVEDVAAYDKSHPWYAGKKPPISYTEEEKEFVLCVAEEMRQPDGVVLRAKLMPELAKRARQAGLPYKYHPRIYPKVAQILNDAGIPGGLEHDPSPRRRRRVI